MAARTSLIVLIAAAYIGGAAALQMCWQYSFLLALVAAPFGGSLAVISAALLLYLRDRDIGDRQFGSAAQDSHKVISQTR